MICAGVGTAHLDVGLRLLRSAWACGERGGYGASSGWEISLISETQNPDTRFAEIRVLSSVSAWALRDVWNVQVRRRSTVEVLGAGKDYITYSVIEEEWR